MSTEPTIDQIAELLRQRPSYLHVFGMGKDRRYRNKPRDLPVLTVASLDGESVHGHPRRSG